MFEKLLEKPSKQLLKIVIIITCLSFIILTILFPICAPNTASTIYGIMNFELAFTSKQIQIIFSVWNTNPLIFQEQILAVYLDYFLYIPSYTLFLGGLVLWFTRKFDGKIQQIGLIITLTPLFAAIFDIIENVGLLVMLNDANGYINGTASAIIPMITSICASIKFLFLIVAIFFALISIIYWVFIRRRKTE